MLFDQADETFCPGCNATEFLQEIQDRPFDQENLGLGPDQGPYGLARLRFGPIVQVFMQGNFTCSKGLGYKGNELDPTDDHGLANYNYGFALARYFAGT